MNCCQCDKILNNESLYGLHKICFKETFCLSEPSEFEDIIIRSQSQDPKDINFNSSFFNGAYRKYSARLGQTAYILKVQQPEFPELPQMEYLCNQIFESLKILVPDYYLIRFPEEQFCFATKNFMSGLINSDLVHIYHFLQDGLQYNCENLIDIIGAQTGRKSEQERFVYLTLADSLIGNHDRHGRNIGFIKNHNRTTLAPFYDNPSAIALEIEGLLGADLQPRGSIYTSETDKPSMKDYVKEWKRLGYSQVIDKFRVNHSIKTICEIIEKSPLSIKRKNALSRLITKRSEELCAN